MGIIGVNGAGKTTLLKLVAGIARPTEGAVRIQGSVAALFEPGMGFHPDFTGRQNIWFETRLLGLDADSIRHLAAAIEEFSGLGDDLDRPLRHYSLGMRMRLAFSAATATRPDILIVDEVLAVGDIRFRIKCIDRIKAFQDQGTILLLASHNPNDLYEICSRGLLIDEGVVVIDGTIQESLDMYEAVILRRWHPNPQALSIHGKPRPWALENASASAQAGAISSAGARIRRAELLDASGLRVDTIKSGAAAVFRVELDFLEAYSDPAVAFRIRNKMGSVLFRTNTLLLNEPIGPVRKNELISVSFKFDANLSDGEYTISAYLVDHLSRNLDYLEALASSLKAVAFRVLKDRSANWLGAHNLFSSASVERLCGEARRDPPVARPPAHDARDNRP